MAVRLPVAVEAEYRGKAAAGEFTREQEGQDPEVVRYGPKLKFEIGTDDEDVQMIPVSAAAFDQVEPKFDYMSLKRGDRVRLHGYVVLQERGSDRDSYFTIKGGTVERLSGVVKPVQAA